MAEWWLMVCMETLFHQRQHDVRLIFFCWVDDSTCTLYVLCCNQWTHRELFLDQTCALVCPMYMESIWSQRLSRKSPTTMLRASSDRVPMIHPRRSRFELRQEMYSLDSIGVECSVLVDKSCVVYLAGAGFSSVRWPTSSWLSASASACLCHKW